MKSVRAGVATLAVTALTVTLSLSPVGPNALLAQSSNPGAPGGDGRGAGAFLAEYYAEVIQRVGETMTAWRLAVREDDIGGSVDSYWEDAQLLFPDRAPIVGKTAIESFYAEFLPTIGELQTSMIDFDASGRMGFVAGPFYYEVPVAGGTPQRIEGTHVTVLIRRGRDWRIRTQIFRLDVRDGSDTAPAG